MSKQLARLLASIEKNKNSLLSNFSGTQGNSRATTAQAINQIYRSFGLPNPLVIWCKSPYQTRLMPYLFNLFCSADRPIIDQLKLLVKNSQSDPLFKNLWRSAEAEIDISTLKKLDWHGKNLRKTFNTQVEMFDSRYKASFQKMHLNEELVRLTICYFSVFQEARNCEKLSEYLSTILFTIQSALPLNVSEKTADYKLTNTYSIERSIGAWSGERLPASNPAITAALLEHPEMHEHIDVSLYCKILALHSNSKKDKKDSELLDNWFKLACGALSYSFFENVCFACQYPGARFDDSMRLHSQNDPAIKFDNDFYAYYWHGVKVPNNIIEHPEKITPEIISAQSNIELRRIMLEIYGLEKYMSNIDATKIHSDKFGTLYRKNFSVGEPLVVVQVTNSTEENDGTRKKYLLKVPPHMTTAKEAVAWSFGLRADEYNPEIES